MYRREHSLQQEAIHMQEGAVTTKGSYSNSIASTCALHIVQEGALAKTGTYSYSVESTCYSRELFIFSREDINRRKHSLKQTGSYLYSVGSICYSREIFIFSRNHLLQ